MGGSTLSLVATRMHSDTNTLFLLLNTFLLRKNEENYLQRVLHIFTNKVRTHALLRLMSIKRLTLSMY